MAEPLTAPFRTASVHCPRCPKAALGAGPLRSCPTCHGSWVAEETLSEHVAIMQTAPPRLQWSVAMRAALPCVVCRAPMETLSLFEVAVDRCRAHGVWFDTHELAEVLHRSAQVREAEPSKLGAIADGIELTADAAEVAVLAETGVEAAVDVAVEVGTSGIVEGILDVLGGIFSAIDL